ncbi:MAG TPA: ferredoxin-type protein NapF [Sedimenticola sp.]|nr:ferredoxin-type protein NapF [Sedimenticola sp.]
MTKSTGSIYFIRSNSEDGHKALRPPWAIPEASFVQACNACGKCIDVCPALILKAGAGRLPQIDFSRGGCLFCGDCEMVCETGALSRLIEPERPPWTLKAYFSDACLIRKGATCYTCREFCEMNAIRLQAVVGGAPAPQLDFDACNGCGECYAPCPTNAISIM